MLVARSISPHLKGLVAYDPKYLPARIYLNANESPYGLPKSVVDALSVAVQEEMFHRYPDPLAKNLRAKLANQLSCLPENILIGNGGDELILDILLAYGGADRNLLIAPPSFSSYELDAVITNTTIVQIAREPNTFCIDEQAIINRVALGDIDVVMLASPNNPTGDVLSEEFIVDLLNASDALVLIDQAYVEFSNPFFSMTKLLAEHENLLLLRTFSKAYALAGLRLGYLLASEQVILELCKVRQPYSVDTFSVLAGMAVLDADNVVKSQIKEVVEQRIYIASSLALMNKVKVYCSEANSILFKLPNAHQLWQRLYEDYGILLRDFSDAPYLKDCLRVSIGKPAENKEFIAATGAILKTREWNET